MKILSNILPFLFFLAADTTALRGVRNVLEEEASETTPPSIVDLSLPLAKAPHFNDNPGARQLQELAAENPMRRSVVVLEDGQMVAEYVREGENPTVPKSVFSHTKSWIGLMVGMLLQDGYLTSVHQTLGEIFDDPQLWSNITEREYRQNITIHELLSMTSGLAKPQFEENQGGYSLYKAIQNPPVSGNKTFDYLRASNIMSYLVPHLTNNTYKTPREYMSATVFPALGMDQLGDIFWKKNWGGVETALHGLGLTHYQMAKLGQLYLQNGKSSAQNQLVDEEWISESTSPQNGVRYYGYFWWIYDVPQVGRIYCAIGMGGQDACYSPTTNRVVALQTQLTAGATDPDRPEPETRNFVTQVTALALNPNTVFTTTTSQQQIVVTDIDTNLTANGDDSDGTTTEEEAGEEAVPSSSDLDEEDTNTSAAGGVVAPTTQFWIVSVMALAVSVLL